MSVTDSELVKTVGTAAAIGGSIGAVLFSVSTLVVQSAGMVAKYEEFGFSSAVASRIWWWHATLAVLCGAAAVAGLGTIRGAGWGHGSLIAVARAAAVASLIAAIATWLAFGSMPTRYDEGPLVRMFPWFRVPLGALMLAIAGAFLFLAARLARARQS